MQSPFSEYLASLRNDDDSFSSMLDEMLMVEKNELEKEKERFFDLIQDVDVKFKTHFGKPERLSKTVECMHAVFTRKFVLDIVQHLQKTISIERMKAALCCLGKKEKPSSRSDGCASRRSDGCASSPSVSGGPLQPLPPPPQASLEGTEFDSFVKDLRRSKDLLALVESAMNIFLFDKEEQTRTMTKNTTTTS